MLLWYCLCLIGVGGAADRVMSSDEGIEVIVTTIFVSRYYNDGEPTRFSLVGLNG